MSNFWKTDIDGGHPILLDDFRYMDAAVRNQIAKAIIGLNGGVLNCIIQGVEFLGQVGPNDTFSEGLLLVNGEIVVADANTASTLDIVDIQVIEIVETADPAGNKTFEDASIHDTYIQRRADINGYFTGAEPVGSVPFRGGSGFIFPRLTDSILGQLVNFLKTWKFIDPGAVVVNTADTTVFSGEGVYWMKVGSTGRLNIALNFLIASGTPADISINAPAGLVSPGAITRFIGLGKAGTTVVEVYLSDDNKIFFSPIDGSDFASGPPLSFRFNSGDFPVNL